MNWRSHTVGGGPLFECGWCLSKKGRFGEDTPAGRMSCEFESRDGVMHTQAKESQRLPVDRQEPEEQNVPPPLGGASPADAAVSDSSLQD